VKRVDADPRDASGGASKTSRARACDRGVADAAARAKSADKHRYLKSAVCRVPCAVTCARQIIRFDPGVGTADRSISSVNLVLFSSDAETTGSASNEGGGGASSARHTAARARMPLFGWTSRARDAAAAASAASAAASPPPAPATPTRGSRDARRRGSSGDVVLSVDADNAAVSVPRELGAGERARASTPPPRLSAEEEEEEEEEEDAVDVELGEIRVVPADGASSEKEKGKKAEKKDDDDDDDERYCRICMERIARAELDAGTATSLGCACVGGFAHVDPCAEQYANAKSDATCEVRVFFFWLIFWFWFSRNPSSSRAHSCAWRTWTRWTPSSRSCARQDAVAREDDARSWS